jgi:ferrous iron transport protein A
MASVPLTFDRPLPDEASGPKLLPRPPREQGRCLAAAAIGETVRVVALSLDRDLCAWLAAVGIDVGERLTVLRRAAFGGPLHVRTRSGGEFALNVALARSIGIEPAVGAGETAA